MPERLGFRVIDVKSEDDKFKALELNVQEPTCNGWRTKSGSEFPQHLILELDKESHIKKIQLLSHHFMITKHFDVFVGKLKDKNCPQDEIDFTCLGQVSLNSHKDSSKKLRELKSVYLDSVGKFIKLVVHKPHDHHLNVHGQVSILAINILGELLDNQTTLDGLLTNPLDGAEDYYSPLDDLSFLMYHDPEAVIIIKQLEEMRKMKDGKEDADQLGALISEMEKTGKILAELEVLKRRAEDAEDMKKSKFMEKEIETCRLGMYSKVKHLKMHHPTHVKLVRTCLEVQSPDIPIGPPKSSSTPNYNPPPPPIDSKPHLSSLERELESSEQSTVTLIASNAYHFYNERPLPTHRKGQRSRLEEEEEDDEEPMRETENCLNAPLEKLSENEEQAAMNIIEIFGVETARKVFSKKWNYKSEGLEAISKFFRTTCQHNNNNDDTSLNNVKISSKDNTELLNSNNNNSNNVKISSKDTAELLNSNNNNSQKDRVVTVCCFSKNALMNVTMAVEDTLTRVFKDNIISVFQSALDVYRDFLLNFVPMHEMPKLDLFLDHTLPHIISRLADISSRRKMASSFIVDLSKSTNFKYKNVLMTECFKMCRQNTTSKMVLGVTQVVFTIYIEQGLKDSGLTCDSLIGHLADSMSNGCSNVRKCAKDFLTKLNSDFETSACPNNQKDEQLAFAANKIKNILFEFDCSDRKSKGEAVISRSEVKPKVEARKPSVVESSQKPLTQNQFDNKRKTKEKKSIQSRAQQPVLAKPIKALKENQPFHKPTQQSPQQPTQQSPQQLTSNQKSQLKTVIKLQSLASKGIPTSKIPQMSNKSQQHLSKQQIQPTKPQPIKQQMLPTTKQLQQHSTPRIQQQDTHITTPDFKRRSFSLDRIEASKDIDRPIIRDFEESKGVVVNNERTCVFCGKEGVLYNLDMVDKHYMGECPMLMKCQQCKIILEVSEMTSHCLNSCPQKDLFKECDKCKRAILKIFYQEHTTMDQCKAIKDGEQSCPICGEVVSREESSWKSHLTRHDACQGRKLLLQQKPLYF